MKLITAHAAHTTTARTTTEHSIFDENTGRKIAHVSVIRGFGHVTGIRGEATEGLRAVVQLDCGDMGNVQSALASKEGLRNGRDDRA